MICELYNDNYQNFKSYNIPAKAQLVISDIPYNLGANAYGSNPVWYVDGDNKNGESKLAGASFFRTDGKFNIAEFFYCCSKLLLKEPKKRGKAPAMIIFCAWQQIPMVQEYGKKYGFLNSYPLSFIKDSSSQVLKANMKIVGAVETALVFHRDKLPKFNNGVPMVLTWFKWSRDSKNVPKIHPCLPTGEKVYINDKWMNIEEVRVGDKSKYGTVTNVSSHIAKNIYEITVGECTVRATWNHPFLVKRGTDIAWCEARLIEEGDEILCRIDVKPYISQLQKGISESMSMENSKWNMSLYGKNITEQSRPVCKSTISTETKQIIELKTCCLSLPLNTSGFTKIASLSMASGSSGALIAENIKSVIPNTGIFQEDGLTEDYAKNVMQKNPCESVKFVSNPVGSVRSIEKKTLVHNLTIDGVPAFDTRIGCSHNTQKPLALLKRLIEIFTYEGDVVIDPCAGSGSTLRAAFETGRNSYGFEVDKGFYKAAQDKMLSNMETPLFASSARF